MWLIIATAAKLPVSSTHSVVGAMMGFGLVAYGGNGIKWKEFGKIGMERNENEIQISPDTVCVMCLRISLHKLSIHCFCLSSCLMGTFSNYGWCYQLYFLCSITIFCS